MVEEAPGGSFLEAEARTTDARCECDQAHYTCSCERFGECYVPTPQPKECRPDGEGRVARECWRHDYCPRPLYPYRTDQLCRRFAVAWVWNGLQLCWNSLYRWEGSPSEWRFVRALPSFVDVWYHGWWGAPHNSPNYRQQISDGWGLFHGNPISIVVNRHYAFLTQSRDTELLHNFFQYDPDGEGQWQGSANGKGTGWAPGGWHKVGDVRGWLHSIAGFYNIYTSAAKPKYESEWKLANQHDRQLVFEHKLGGLPGRFGVFFSARCSDDDHFISVVKYSWGAFNPVEIEVNAVQVVLHLGYYMNMGGFWLPHSWYGGRFYAYASGCFKVTASNGAVFDSGWVDDKWLGYSEPQRFPDWQVTKLPDTTDEEEPEEARKTARRLGIAHNLDGIPREMVVYFSPHQTSEGATAPADHEAFAVMHGYNPVLSGNPATIWADHNGIHLEMWRYRWLRGTWRSSCAHLQDGGMTGKEWDKIKADCKPGWRFHFKGSWRVMAMGCTRLKDYFGIGPKDIWGDGT